MLLRNGTLHYSTMISHHTKDKANIGDSWLFSHVWGCLCWRTLTDSLILISWYLTLRNIYEILTKYNNMLQIYIPLYSYIYIKHIPESIRMILSVTNFMVKTSFSCSALLLTLQYILYCAWLFNQQRRKSLNSKLLYSNIVEGGT